VSTDSWKKSRDALANWRPKMPAKLAIVIPTYQSVSTTFFAHFLGLDRTGVDVTATIVCKGVYVAAAMRGFRDELLARDPNFDRMLVIESDMILPKDALQKHASYTEPIVGGAYFMHEYPYQPIFTAPNDDNSYHRTFSVKEVRDMIANPGLYEALNVGFGCTSISREVLENWPEGTPIFANQQGLTTDNHHIEIGHDVAFNLNARRLGWKTYVDTSLQCGHLTEVQITAEDNAKAFTTIVEDVKAGVETPYPWAEDHWESRLSDLAVTPGAEHVEDYTEVAGQHASTRVI
jgi:hypothetical protein